MRHVLIAAAVFAFAANYASAQTSTADPTAKPQHPPAGGVTSLTQGCGITLTPNPITTTGSIAADTTYLQRRVSSSCAVGSSIRAIAADGTVTCQAGTSPSLLVWVDSNGTVVGNVLDVDNVVMSTDDVEVLILRMAKITTPGVFGATWGTPPVFFSGLDCTGNKYINAAWPGSTRSATVLPELQDDGTWQYYLLLNGNNWGPVTIQSMPEDYVCRNGEAHTDYMWDTQPPISLPFVPPFYYSRP